jgi:hypothetical protein
MTIGLQMYDGFVSSLLSSRILMWGARRSRPESGRSAAPFQAIDLDRGTSVKFVAFLVHIVTNRSLNCDSSDF